MTSTGRDFFDDQKNEFIIHDMFPQRPKFNYLWNESVLAKLNQFGCGSSYYLDQSGKRRTLCREGDSRLVYIRDEEGVWAANRNFERRGFGDFHTAVGLGYSQVRSDYRGLSVSLKIFVPRQHAVECWEVEVENTGKTEKTFQMFVYADACVDVTGHAAYNRGEFDRELNGVLLTHRGFDTGSDMRGAFFACDQKPDAFETTNRRFKGVYGGMEMPDAVRKGKLSSEETSFDDAMAAALEFDLTLWPGEKRKFRYLLGVYKSRENALEEHECLLREGAFECELQQIEKSNQDFASRIGVETPDEAINRMANIWLKRQMDLGKTWGRVYAKGFRDIMQDVTGFMPLNSETAGSKIKYCLRYQFGDGNTLRQWEENDYHPYRDGASWIVPAVACYLRETGDYGFLQEPVPYFESNETGTVLDHCLRGMDFLFSHPGEHGLCQWGGGDWNDSINAAGLQGIGESVWLSEAAVSSAVELAELLQKIGRADLAESFRKKAEAMKENIRRYGWDGDHFIYGYNDWREKIGSYENLEGKIYLNPQSWAVLSGVVGREEGARLLNFVENELCCPFGYVQLKPSYTHGDDHIGRISYMQPGCYENGSVYNHGVAFKIAADCRLGRGNLAYQTLMKMLILSPESPAAGSGAEPYALTNMFLGPDNGVHTGESLMAWITGSAGWVFRCITEYMVGIQAEYGGLKIAPCLPEHWKKVRAVRQYRNAVYHIEILNPRGLQTGRVLLRVDGKEMSGDLVPAFSDGKEHTVLAELTGT